MIEQPSKELIRWAPKGVIANIVQRIDYQKYHFQYGFEIFW